MLYLHHVAGWLLVVGDLCLATSKVVGDLCLATSKVISRWILTCASVHSWWLYSAASPCHSTQSHYPDNEPTSPCIILMVPSTWLGSNKYQFLSHWFDLTSIHAAMDRQGLNRLISKNDRQMLYSFGHPVWSQIIWVIATGALESWPFFIKWLE